MANTLATLVVRMQADVGAFSRDLGRASHVSEREWRKVRRHAQDAARVIAVAATIAGAALLKFGKDAIDTADDLSKMSQRVGVSTESLSALSYAAKLADVSTAQLSTGLRQLAKNAQDTAAGTGEARLAFEAMKLSATDAGGKLKGTEALLLEIADRFEGMEDGAGKTALAMKIFGRAGADLIPLLNQGSAGLKANADEARRMGLIISTETGKAAEEFNDSLTRLKAQLQGMAFEALPAVISKLRDLVEQFNEGIKIAGGFGSALRLFGLSNLTQENAAQKIDEITAAIERAQAARQRAIDQGRTKGNLIGNYDRQIADLQKQLEFARMLRQQGRRGETGDTGIPTSGGGTKTAAPLLPDEAALRKAAADLKKTYDLVAAGEEEFQQQSAEAWRLYWDQYVKRQKEALTKAQEQQQTVFAMIDKEQEDAIEHGAIVARDVTENHKKLEEQQNRNKEAAKQLGLTFSSAFEDAIVSGKKFRDVLKGLVQDVARIVVRKTVTERLAGAIAGIFSFGGAKASGGPVSAGSAFLVGERGPELFVPNTSGNIVPNGAGGTVFNVDMRGASVEAVRRLEQLVMRVNGSIESRAVAAVSDSRRRGG